MADNEKEVKLKLTAEDQVTSVVDRVKESLGGAGQAITAVSTAFTAASKAVEIAQAAYHKVSEALQESINAAAQSEASEKRLAAALIQTGNYSKAAFEQMNALSGAIQKNTGVSDEAAKDLMTMGVSLGMTAEQAQKATQAALDLSAATGQSAESAMRQLSLSLNGASGKLGLMVPAVKGLTKAQLENGDAIDIIARKYDGFAKNASNTYAGALAKSQQALDDVKESIGGFITQNPIVIKYLTDQAEKYARWAASIGETQKYLLAHIDTIANYAKGLGIAVVAVGAIAAAYNYATIATNAWRLAEIGLKAVQAASPIGLMVLGVVALGAAIGYLIDNFDKVAGAVKVGLGYALQIVTAQFQVFIAAISKVVGVFNSDWAKSISSVNDQINGYADGLKNAGKAQMEAADTAKKAAQATSELGSEVKGMEAAAAAQEQAMRKLSGEFVKFKENAKAAQDAVKEFAPQLSLKDWEEKNADFTKQLKDLKTKAQAIIVKLTATIGPLDPDSASLLKQAQEEAVKADEALKGLTLKNASIIRETKIKEADLAIQTIYNKAISAEREIFLKQVAGAEALRAKRVELATQRLIEEEGIDRHGIDVRTQARIAADALELSSFQEFLTSKLTLSISNDTKMAMARKDNALAMQKQQLDAEMNLAVSAELAKQGQLAALKAQVGSGLGGAGGAALGQDAAVQAEMERQAKLQALRQAGQITEQTFEQAVTESRIAVINARTQTELALMQQRADLLGLSDAGMQVQLDRINLQYANELAALELDHSSKLLSDANYKTALEEAELNHQANINSTKEAALQADLARNVKLKDDWGAALAAIRLQQQQHGKILGTIQGIQQSEQFKGLQGALSDTASLMSSGNKTAFEVGKGAAIAQATINTFMSATAAFASLAAIPIVGPVLGAAAAAAAVASGIANIAKIKSQKFAPGGQAHGGLDEVPQSMNNKSFLLKGGEGVLQPEANKDLRQAADKINNGGGAGQTFNMTFTIHGTMSDSQANELKAQVIAAVRDASERGEPVINEKGIVRAS